MAGVNKVIILGRLGQDPELRTTQGGQTVCTLNLATSESWVKDGQKEEKTEWHRVVLWAKQAELAGKYLKKGRNVFVEGRLQTRSWEDAQGQKRFTTEIVANQITFVDSAGGAGASRNDDNHQGFNDGPESNFGGGHQNQASSNRGSFKPLDVVSNDDDVPF